MPDSPPPRPQVVRKIRPAGWVVIALLVGGLAWGAWRLAGPLLLQPSPGGPAQPQPPAPTPTADAGPAAPGTPTPAPAPKAGVVLPARLFPAPGPKLPEPAAAPARLALPRLNALPAPEKALPQPSEVAALRALARGEADLAVASVAALAAAPEAIANGVRAVWLLGHAPADAQLLPSCEPEALRSSRLGAVRGSLGHFHLLAALAGAPLPEITLFDAEADLQRALSEGAVAAGARVAPSGAVPACLALPPEAFAFVVLRRKDAPADPAQVAAVVAAWKAPARPGADVAAFFDPHRRAPGGFEALFEAAGAVWAAAGVVARPAKARDAVDRSLVEPSPAVAAPGAPDAPPAPAAGRTESRHGFPAWVDR